MGLKRGSAGANDESHSVRSNALATRTTVARLEPRPASKFLSALKETLARSANSFCV